MFWFLFAFFKTFNEFDIFLLLKRVDAFCPNHFGFNIDSERGSFFFFFFLIYVYVLDTFNFTPYSGRQDPFLPKTILDAFQF